MFIQMPQNKKILLGVIAFLLVTIPMLVYAAVPKLFTPPQPFEVELSPKNSSIKVSGKKPTSQIFKDIETVKKLKLSYKNNTPSDLNQITAYFHVVGIPQRLFYIRLEDVNKQVHLNYKLTRQNLNYGVFDLPSLRPQETRYIDLSFVSLAKGKIQIEGWIKTKEKYEATIIPVTVTVE